MKIYYIPPKGKKKKDVKLYTLGNLIGSMFVLDEDTMLVVLVLAFFIICYGYNLIVATKEELQIKREDDLIKAFDRKQKLQKIADAGMDNTCMNVNVKNLL